MFQDKNIYFLDDIMSAVDVNVARHIFNKCISGLLRNKTRILCTHHIQYLLSADHILVMEDGRITQQGKYSASAC
jgi:ATP-binding cassette subfamily C (CFTR/MRP) protein 10